MIVYDFNIIFCDSNKISKKYYNILFKYMIYLKVL